LVVKIIRH